MTFQSYFNHWRDRMSYDEIVQFKKLVISYNVNGKEDMTIHSIERYIKASFTIAFIQKPNGERDWHRRVITDIRKQTV